MFGQLDMAVDRAHDAALIDEHVVELDRCRAGDSGGAGGMKGGDFLFG